MQLAVCTAAPDGRSAERVLHQLPLGAVCSPWAAGQGVAYVVVTVPLGDRIPRTKHSAALWTVFCLFPKTVLARPAAACMNTALE